MKTFWTEIRNDYFDEDDRFWRIDAWKTNDDNEEGKVIAYVDDLTARVLYVDPLARIDDYAQEMIRELVNEINKREEGYKFIKTDVADDDGSDCYSAIHYFMERN